MILLIATLLAPAQACEPPEWRVEVLWPAQNDIVPQDAAPLAALTTGFDVEMVVERSDPDPEVIAGTVVETAIESYGSTHRFIPDEPLPDGDYTLRVASVDADHLETVSFEVGSRRTSPPAAPVAGVTAEWINIIHHGGDPCGGPDQVSSVDIGFDETTDPGANTIARSVHLVDGPDGTVETDPMIVSEPWSIGYGVGPEGLTADDRVCVAIRSWGTQPEHDRTSEIACTEREKTASGCTSSGSAPAGIPLSFLGFLAVGVRRRRGASPGV